MCLSRPPRRDATSHHVVEVAINSVFMSSLGQLQVYCLSPAVAHLTWSVCYWCDWQERTQPVAVVTSGSWESGADDKRPTEAQRPGRRRGRSTQLGASDDDSGTATDGDRRHLAWSSRRTYVIVINQRQQHVWETRGLINVTVVIDTVAFVPVSIIRCNVTRALSHSVNEMKWNEKCNDLKCVQKPTCI